MNMCIRMSIRTFIAAVFLAGYTCMASAAPAPERVVTLGGSVTEIVYALDRGALLVATDESSLYPEAATRLPRVGYYRNVPLEGVVSMQPDLVLASSNTGPPHALERIAGLGITVEKVSDDPNIESLYRRIGQVAEALGAQAEGRALAARIRADVARAQQGGTPALRTVVLINRTGTFMAAGRHTAADAVLGLAGLPNALADQQGYKPLSTEGLAALRPELIIITAASAQASGGLQAFSRQAGVSSTPAGRQGRVFGMDDALILGIGPRVAQAITQLKQAAH